MHEGYQNISHIWSKFTARYSGNIFLHRLLVISIAVWTSCRQFRNNWIICKCSYIFRKPLRTPQCFRWKFSRFYLFLRKIFTSILHLSYSYQLFCWAYIHSSLARAVHMQLHFAIGRLFTRIPFFSLWIYI